MVHGCGVLRRSWRPALWLAGLCDLAPRMATSGPVGAAWSFLRYAACFKGKVSPLPPQLAEAECASVATPSRNPMVASALTGDRPTAPSRPAPGVPATASTEDLGDGTSTQCVVEGEVLERLEDGLVLRPPKPVGSADCGTKLVVAAKSGDQGRKRVMVSHLSLERLL